MLPGVAVVVPWVRDEEKNSFLSRWGVLLSPPTWLIMQHDWAGEGCGVTKNKGIAHAVAVGYDIVVVLDGDCYPANGTEGARFSPPTSLEQLAAAHVEALRPQQVEMFQAVTEPPSRGTPYADRTMTMPVAASMGFWTKVGDYCAVRQLSHSSAPMTFERSTVFGRYFPLCGMNLAFRPQEWDPWCRFIDVARFDDIWMGWLWQREAYRRGHCFNLAGPVVQHARQSNVWKNLQQEAVYLRENETLWREIATNGASDYERLRSLLPVPVR